MRRYSAESGLAEPETAQLQPWDDAAPLSEAVGLAALTADGPEYKPVLGEALLSQESAPFSKWPGLPVFVK